jgi:hypothetical protein
MLSSTWKRVRNYISEHFLLLVKHRYNNHTWNQQRDSWNSKPEDQQNLSLKALSLIRKSTFNRLTCANDLLPTTTTVLGFNFICLKHKSNFEQRLPINNNHFLWVPRVVVVLHRFDCIFQTLFLLYRGAPDWACARWLACTRVPSSAACFSLLAKRTWKLQQKTFQWLL